jgi:septin family protein
MKKFGQNIYANFKPISNSSKEYGNALNVFILGYAGHGKTTIYNNLCKKNESVGFAFQSVTSEIVFAQCKHLSNNQTMNIYDSPGII